MITTNGHILKVQLSGIHLASCGLLATTPDGLVGSNGLLEVKCPYGIREFTVQEWYVVKKAP